MFRVGKMVEEGYELSRYCHVNLMIGRWARGSQKTGHDVPRLYATCFRNDRQGEGEGCALPHHALERRVSSVGLYRSPR